MAARGGLARETLAALWAGSVDLDAAVAFEIFVNRLGKGAADAAAVGSARRLLSRQPQIS